MYLYMLFHLYKIYIHSLNTVREICTRCPLAMNEVLLEDLIRYKQYKERSVMMAARSLIGTFRRVMPHLLRKKDRGRSTEASIMIKSSKYGEIQANEFISGAEILCDQHTDSSEETDNTEVSTKMLYYLIYCNITITLTKSIYTI